MMCWGMVYDWEHEHGGGGCSYEIRNKDELKGSVASPELGLEDQYWSHFKAVLH